jgi:hypothetical protein
MDEFASRQYPVQEDMRFQRRSWIVERAGWVVLALIALAGLSGVLGNGPASWAHAGAGPLTVSYQRFQRATRVSDFTFDVARVAGNDLTLKLGPSFQRDFELTSIQPPPLRSRADPDGFELTFAANAGARSRIVIWAHSRRYGRQTITATANGGPPVSFWLFVYP